jgi:hypothetical protein
MEPLWEATKGFDTMVVLPMLRYVNKGCCDDAQHVTNRTEPGFVTKIAQDLREVTLGLKKYLAGTGRSQCQVMDPNVDLCQVEAKLIWGEDPIDPQHLGYDKTAMGLKLVEGKLEQRLQTEAAKGPKRPRLEATPRMEQQASRPQVTVGRMERDIRLNNSEDAEAGEWYTRGGYGGHGGARGQVEFDGGRGRRRGYYY